MLKEFSILIRSVVFLLLIFSFCPPAPAQNQKPSDDKKSKTANESCDGALEIVPVKSMTFARKRRPLQQRANGEPARQSSPEARDSHKDSKAVKKNSGSGP